MTSWLQAINDPSWHARVWRLSVPVILANLSPPLVGLADTAVMGRMPDASHLAAVTLGAVVLSSIYWLFGFLRMGTTARVAQAYGADDTQELFACCLRAALLALGLTAVLFALSPGFLLLARLAFDTEPAVETMSQSYLAIRLLGLPAYLLQLVLLGALFGLQRMTLAMALMVALNGLNLGLDVLFVVHFGWGVDGVAWGTVLSEWLIVLITLPIVARLVRPKTDLNRGLFWDTTRWRSLFGMSQDLFIRTLFVQLPFLANVKLATQLGTTIVAGNAILMQLFFVSTFALDGIAHAAESLAGYAVGRNDRAYLQQTLVYSALWATIFALLLSLIFACFADSFIDFMTTIEPVAQSAKTYVGWLIALPLLGVFAFLFDGLFIGAGATRELRNSMVLAASAYIIMVAATLPSAGNNALWLAMAVFMVVRSATLARTYPKLATQLTTN